LPSRASAKKVSKNERVFRAGRNHWTACASSVPSFQNYSSRLVQVE